MKVIVSVVSTSLLAMSVYSYRLSHQLQQERSHASYLSAQLLAAASPVEEAPAASNSAPVSDIRNAPAMQKTFKPNAEIPRDAAIPSPKESLLGLQALLSDPTQRARLKEQQVAMANIASANGAQSMGMDEATYERFQEFLAEQKLQNLEGASANDKNPVDGDRDINERITGEFGSDVAARFQSNKDNAVGAIQMKDALSTFAEADVALSKTQRQLLVQAFTSATNAEPGATFSGTAEDVKEMAEFQQQYLANVERQNQRVLADAQNFLSATQLSLFQKYLDQRVAEQRVANSAVHPTSAAPAPLSSGS